MTSNVFGHIAAENLGYGKVELQRTIAEGHSECRVVVYLRPTAEAEKAEGREYVRGARLKRGPSRSETRCDARNSDDHQRVP